MKPKFIHLNVHSEFSLIDSVIRTKQLLSACGDDAMPAVAITDRVNLFGAVRFHKQALAAGIKSIFGSELLIAAEDGAPYPINVLCQNEIGYKNLTELISKAYRDGQTNGLPLIDRQWLYYHNDGLIILSGAHWGDIGRSLLKDNQAQAEQWLSQWCNHFGDRFYLEIQRIGHANEAVYNPKILELAQAKSVPVVATNAVRFITADDFEAHEARVAINQGVILEDPNRARDYTEQQYLRSQQEMGQLFADIPEALINSVEIAKRCNHSLQLGEAYLPNFPTPNNESVEDYLVTAAQQGLTKQLELILDKTADDYQEKLKVYQARLERELSVINSMGFAGYFLIVADFIRWAKNNGVPVGPGRGSGAGSLVAFALEITGIDPLAYDLLFERFLNPERISMPDFDIDFCMDGRDRVIEYVAERYGQEKVSQIITFGTMAAKAVVRDVGRVLGFPYGFVDKIAKLIPFEIGMTLEKALAQEEALRDRYDQEEDVKGLIDLARKLEGLVRNAGKHAGGVVIAPSKLTDFTPLYFESIASNPVSQFDKDDVEAVGLVKFDFLGLRTLTIIDWAVKTINAIKQQQGEALINIEQIPLQDEKTFKLLKANATTGVFQLESRGMKDLIRRLQPDCFEEIIALVALFRPGPLQSGMVDDFINRKHGRAKIVYPHPKLVPILQSTYGVILYQEQVMQIAQVLAGYTLGGADMLRRAMGKKKPEEMARQREIFTKGAVENNVDAKLANEIFDLMEKFAGYGFNKSHSAAYALVSYQTAWLKAHYPAAFMASVLSSDMDHTDKVVIFIEECRLMGLTVESPNINQSLYKFTAKEDCDDTILYGLGAIKGVGESAVELIIHERDINGDYQDLFEFCRRLDLRKVNKRVLESLIRSGSFDCFDVNRATLMASLEAAMKAAEQNAARMASGQNDMFGDMFVANADDQQVLYNNVDPWPDDIRLQGEKETLGLYLTGHPIEQHQAELKQLISAPIAELKFDGNKTFLIAGLIVAMRTMMTKRGDRMAFVTLDDRTGRIELAVFSDTYQEYRELLIKDELVLFEAEGSFDESSSSYKLSASRLFTLGQAREQYARNLIIKLQQQELSNTTIERLQAILKPYSQGPCPVCIEYQRHDAKALVEFPKQWWVHPSDEVLNHLAELIGKQNVGFYY